MSHGLAPALAPLAEAGLGAPLALARPLGGGDICAAYWVQSAEGQEAFLKGLSRAPEGFFEAEAAGLRALAEVPGAPPVPRVIAARREGLLLEHLPPGQSGPEAWRRFGRQLAQLHRQGHGAFGAPADNFIGRTPQDNRWCESGAEFYATRRLGPQLERAARAGLLEGRLLRDLEALTGRLAELLPREAPPALIHGDLWRGNAYSGPEGAIFLIDPAAHYGHREAELAMTHLFGPFPRPFYEGYDEAWPLLPGAKARRGLYNLYHLLNHLNLFGPSYRSSVEATLAPYL